MIARKNWLHLLSRSWSLFDYLPAEQSGQMRADAAQNGIDTETYLKSDHFVGGGSKA